MITDRMTPIREVDLHAYVDGTLDDSRRLEVEAWLAGHPADVERVAIWAAQNQALHAAFDPVLNEPLPLELIRATRGQHSRSAPLWQALAAVILLASSGLLGYGIGVGSAPASAPLAYFSRDAALAHLVFSPEQRHPVEVEAAQAEHLVTWLSKRLGSRLAAPDFTAHGFELLGGRLLAGGGGPVAQFMYQDTAQRRITLYVRRDVGVTEDSSIRHAVENGVEVSYWIDRDLGYALSGNIMPAEMKGLADTAYRQIEGGKTQPGQG